MRALILSKCRRAIGVASAAAGADKLAAFRCHRDLLPLFQSLLGPLKLDLLPALARIVSTRQCEIKRGFLAGLILPSFRALALEVIFIRFAPTAIAPFSPPTKSLRLHCDGVLRHAKHPSPVGKQSPLPPIYCAPQGGGTPRSFLLQTKWRRFPFVYPRDLMSKTCQELRPARYREQPMRASLCDWAWHSLDRRERT